MELLLLALLTMAVACCVLVPRERFTPAVKPIRFRK